MNPTLTLYTNHLYSSPYVLSVYATLYEKGLPFELKTLNLGVGEQLSAPYSKLSLTSRVPTLVAGDFALSESSAIIEYLEEAYASPDFVSVFPTDLQHRAKARQIQAWVRSDLAELRAERPTSVIYSAKNPKTLSAPAQKAADKLLRIADTLIDDQGNPLFGAWCIADVDFSVMLNRLCANGDTVPLKIRKYVDRQSQRPCVETWWALAQS
ncbi:glutathione transferase [Alcaligenaceae bacterium]|nr:glutathione transferase [Alcaligenaceae bacterium]